MICLGGDGLRDPVPERSARRSAPSSHNGPERIAKLLEQLTDGQAARSLPDGRPREFVRRDTYSPDVTSMVKLMDPDRKRLWTSASFGVSDLTR